MAERWKPVRGYEGYFSVSDRGRVRSETRTVPHGRFGTVTYRGKLLSPTPVVTKAGTRMVISLSRGHSARRFLVHRLVAQAFVANPKRLAWVIHKNGDGACNRATNLLWVNQSEAVRRKYRSGSTRRLRGEKNPTSLLRNKDVRRIRRMLATGRWSQREIAHQFGVVPMVISDIKHRKTWSHVK